MQRFSLFLVFPWVPCVNREDSGRDLGRLPRSLSSSRPGLIIVQSRSADADVFVSCSVLLLGTGPPHFRFQPSHGGLAEHCPLDALADRTHGEEESHPPKKSGPRGGLGSGSRRSKKPRSLPPWVQAVRLRPAVQRRRVRRERGRHPRTRFVLLTGG